MSNRTRGPRLHDLCHLVDAGRDACAGLRASGRKVRKPAKGIWQHCVLRQVRGKLDRSRTQYKFTLVDVSDNNKVLGTVMVTAIAGPGSRAAGRVTGVISAAPSPCLILPGKNDCTTYLTWSTTGAEHARVYVTAEGAKGAPEKEFGTGKSCAKCGASWIEAGTKYLFTLVDWSSGSRGANLASVTVTAVK